MEHFEIGSCFRSYNELMEKLKEYCKETHAKYTTKDCRLIKDQFVHNNARERLVYTDLKLICVHGRSVRPPRKEFKRKRSEKNLKTGCPAYFRLKLIYSGIALQIVALNVKHNHPLEPEPEAKREASKVPKRRGRKRKNPPPDLDEDELGNEEEKPERLELKMTRRVRSLLKEKEDLNNIETLDNSNGENSENKEEIVTEESEENQN